MLFYRHDINPSLAALSSCFVYLCPHHVCSSSFDDRLDVNAKFLLSSTLLKHTHTRAIRKGRPNFPYIPVPIMDSSVKRYALETRERHQDDKGSPDYWSPDESELLWCSHEDLLPANIARFSPSPYTSTSDNELLEMLNSAGVTPFPAQNAGMLQRHGNVAPPRSLTRLCFTFTTPFYVMSVVPVAWIRHCKPPPPPPREIPLDAARTALNAIRGFVSAS